MSIVSTFLTGAGSVSDVAKHSTDPRPLSLQPEEAGAPAFDALLGAAMGPGAGREARERHEAGVDRGRRAERSRSTERANERASARAAERARASAATAERASAERAGAAREAGAASASRRADELRYGMLSERRAAAATDAAAADIAAAEAATAAADAAATATEAIADAGVPPQHKAATDGAEPADQTSAAGTEATAQATPAAEAAQAAAAAQLAESEAAAAAALAAAATDPTRVVRDAGTLAPEFRERLERVVSRMEREFGHEVLIVEAARTSERQDFLYEQGRTREGAVVTWTRDSKHLDGRAADVMIDGSYADQAAFQRLHAIAAEEGLRTLGARDPGHIEFTGAAAGSARGAAALAALQTMATIEEVRVAPAGGVATGGVAEVAEVAQVAQVAEVAPVATPGLGGGIGAPRAAIAQERSNGGASDERSERRARTADAVEGHVAERREERADAQAGLRMAAERAPQLGLGVEATAPVAATDAASRISRVLELQDAAATPRPMSHMTLRLDNAAGGEDRIRVDLRGLGVGTNIDVTDAATADRLGARVSELQRALGQHGLESESVRIGVRPELPDAARTAAAAAAHLTERDVLRTSDTGASSSQHQQSQSQDSQRQGADDRRRTARDQDEPGQQAGESRHRSRKEPQGDRTR